MFECKQCKISFKPNKMKTQIFCSRSCMADFNRIYPKTTDCKNCNTLVIGRRRKFCSKSCAAEYNNKNKSFGIRRSNLEIYIENTLKSLFSEDILFNSKSIIGSELDIYFPDRKIAFEINGIFHYEPIFGENKFNRIQQNDRIKENKCKDLGIKLYVIDVSEQTFFKEESSRKFINFILDKLK